jgi:hypothetical protein
LADYAAAAAQSLDLTGVLAVLDSFRKVAEITQRPGVEAHTRMLGGRGPSERNPALSKRGFWMLLGGNGFERDAVMLLLIGVPVVIVRKTTTGL